ncbi:hypothetical protein KFL_003860030 [Klebsormidium nitens]|uniref:Uncharacterized protein n=1 Tax=Klebsormidium nitens TaxID=105231 RepID=A0A1Y1IGR0_KLENI|nr:hypothetical protein KFL_003860030 [Klebsormidium nitens]|eukprot:GAQ87897.1 hypothetical protein KFL_003860030 [Klebsormidium nitens]
MASQAALSSLQAASPSGFAFRKAVGGDQILACPQGGLAPIRAATKVIPKKIAPPKKNTGTQKIASGTQIKKSGTQIVKNAASAAANGAASLPRKAIKVVEVFGPKETKGLIRDKRNISGDVKVLSRVQELRLLTKAEESGLLSTLEGLGFTLSTIESLGLLSKAEDLGLLGAVTDRKLPGTLLLASLVVLAAGPAIVYFGPEDSSAIVIAEYVVAALTVAGGAALFGASKLVKALQA